MKSPALKAGLIGAAIVLVLNLIGIIPVIGCIGLPLELVAYGVIGALAALWMTPRREAGRAAGQGALAGLIAGRGERRRARDPDANIHATVRRDLRHPQPGAT